jgi:hypothetical protein
VLRSVRAIEESDVCLMLIDAQDGVNHQDLHIFSMIEKGGKGVVVVVNKWDLIQKDTMTTKSYEEEIRRKLAPFTDLPVVFTSVTEKQRIHKALELAMQVYANRAKRIPTRKLNDVMLPEIERMPPPMYKAKSVRIKYVTQLPGVVPAFAFFCNLPQYVKESYTRFLENKLRSTSTSRACRSGSSSGRNRASPQLGQDGRHDPFRGTGPLLHIAFGVGRCPFQPAPVAGPAPQGCGQLPFGVHADTGLRVDQALRLGELAMLGPEDHGHAPGSRLQQVVYAIGEPAPHVGHIGILIEPGQQPHAVHHQAPMPYLPQRCRDIGRAASFQFRPERQRRRNARIGYGHLLL